MEGVIPSVWLVLDSDRPGAALPASCCTVTVATLRPPHGGWGTSTPGLAARPAPRIAWPNMCSVFNLYLQVFTNSLFLIMQL